LLTLIERKKLKNIYCWEDDIQRQLNDIGVNFSHEKTTITKALVGITSCESLVARTGSVLLSSAKNGRAISIFPQIHIVVANTSQVVMELKEAMQSIKNAYGRAIPSMLSFTTGPSRTTELDNTTVIGANGPKELFVFLIDDHHNH
nr:LUD domain-containing protein [Bacteroidia bacterium]